MRAVRKYTSERWVILYIERWLKAPVQIEGGAIEPRKAGTPQGGVISPLLANIFLHLAFDTWMAERHPGMPFERYADDVIVHCRTEQQAQDLLHQVKERLRRCRLEVHPQKTKIVYCRDSRRRGSAEVEKFDFLGFTFRTRSAKGRRGEMFASFSPAISRTAAVKISQTMRRQWQIRKRTYTSLDDIAKKFNPIIRGWIQYYGSYYRSALYQVFRPLDYAIIKWVTRKYKRYRRHKRRARRWLEAIARRQPTLFAHWSLGRFVTAE
jgi:RNA-directed DNA polymerase